MQVQGLLGRSGLSPAWIVLESENPSLVDVCLDVLCLAGMSLAAGTQFTGCTSTTVQILTPEGSRCRGLREHAINGGVLARIPPPLLDGGRCVARGAMGLPATGGADRDGAIYI